MSPMVTGIVTTSPGEALATGSETGTPPIDSATGALCKPKNSLT